MAKRHKPEEIIAKLRQVDVMTGRGSFMVVPCRLTLCRWKSHWIAGPHWPEAQASKRPIR
jgi:hypothetical protein